LVDVSIFFAAQTGQVRATGSPHPLFAWLFPSRPNLSASRASEQGVTLICFVLRDATTVLMAE